MDHPCISLNEYEQERPVLEFLKWIEWYKRDLIWTNPAAGIESIERKSLVGKLMYEEAHPISHFLSARPSLKNATIKLCSGSQSYDGQIRVGGQTKLHLEVTQAIDQDEHKKRRALAETGVSYPEYLMEYGCLAGLASQMTRARIGVKENKKYPEGTVLIIAVDDDYIMSDDLLFQNYLGDLCRVGHESQFSEIFVCTHNGTHSATINSPPHGNAPDVPFPPDR